VRLLSPDERFDGAALEAPAQTRGKTNAVLIARRELEPGVCHLPMLQVH